MRPTITLPSPVTMIPASARLASASGPRTTTAPRTQAALRVIVDLLLEHERRPVEDEEEDEDDRERLEPGLSPRRQDVLRRNDARTLLLGHLGRKDLLRRDPLDDVLGVLLRDRLGQLGLRELAR